jgi:hypothetical protein
MSRSRLPKLIMQYIPKGRRDRGRPMKKQTDSEAGTGQQLYDDDGSTVSGGGRHKGQY